MIDRWEVFVYILGNNCIHTFYVMPKKKYQHTNDTWLALEKEIQLYPKVAQEAAKIIIGGTKFLVLKPPKERLHLFQITKCRKLFNSQTLTTTTTIKSQATKKLCAYTKSYTNATNTSY